MDGWNNSNQNLDEYLNIGDEVDREIYWYFIEVLPPACMSSTCVQIGEPYTHIDGKPAFNTLEKINGKWTYTGIKTTPKEQECTYLN